ncbi:hypothetical protein J5X84_42030 [Streptosporangiaceae bacterium NEAU-GS5]|nr:hypothetical protein [Streptosporangiaceae bacterium NEAU-GS5]
MRDQGRIIAIFVLLAALVGCSGLGGGNDLPAPRGAILQIDGSYPYTVQGMHVALLSTYQGKSASSGYLFAVVSLQVAPVMPDRPTPLPRVAFSRLVWKAPICATSGCVGPFGAINEPVEINRGGDDPAEWGLKEFVMEPGHRYYVRIYAVVPGNVSLKTLRICDYGAADSAPCIKAADLSHS